MDRIVRKYKKHFVICTLAIIGLSMCVSVPTINDYFDRISDMNGFYNRVVLYEQYQKEIEVKESSFVGGFMGAIVGLLVAVNVVPIIANMTATLEENDDLDSSEQALVGTWVLFLIITVIGMILGGMAL